MKNKRQKKDGNTNNLSNRKLDFEDLKKHNNKPNMTAAEKIDTRETIKPVSSTSWYKRKNDSEPLILPQPKVEDHKIKRIKNKQIDFAQEKVNELMESNPSSNKKSKASDEKSKDHNEDELVQREKRVSSMMNQFSSMLKFDGAFSSKENVTDKLEELLTFNNEASTISEESYLLEGEFPTSSEEIISKKFKFDAGEENSLGDECLIGMEETSSILEESQTNEEEPTLESEFTAMLEERTVWEEAGSKGEKSSLESMFTAMLEETSPCWEEAESNEEEPTLESGFAAMLEDECTLEEEYESIVKEPTLESEFSMLLEEEMVLEEGPETQEEASTLESEYTKLLEEESHLEEDLKANVEASKLESDFSMLLEEDASKCDESASANEESTSKEHEMSSEKNDFEDELLGEEEEKEEYFHSSLEPIISQDCSKKEFLPIVKVPVLLAQVNIDIEMFDSLELNFPIANITKIDWVLDSFECRVLLPSTTVFLKGILTADIEYVNSNHSQILQTVKVPVPWEKVTTINWLYPPVLSNSSQREFMFKSLNDNNGSSHYEFCHQFADQIKHDLRGVNIIWNDELISHLSTSKLHIQGSVNISIDLLQSQYIDLNGTRS